MSSRGSDRGQATMSVSVRRLQDALQQHLDETSKSRFVDLLNHYHVHRDMQQFTHGLKTVLDTPAKRQLLALIRKVIPKGDVQAYDQYLYHSGESRKFDTVPAKRPKKTQRSRPPLTGSHSSKISFLPLGRSKKASKEKLSKLATKSDSHIDSLSSPRSTLKGSMDKTGSRVLKSALKEKQNDIKHIRLKHSLQSGGQGYGFSIRGGVDFGTGVYVSMVEERGAAHEGGLQAGDLVLKVNGQSLEKITHAEAAQLIQGSQDQLDLVVCRVGRIPGTSMVHQSYCWVDRAGRPTTPPPELASAPGRETSNRTDSLGRKSTSTLLQDSQERKMSIRLDDAESLGVMIRGGHEFGLGIYISGVDQMSAADNAGLKVGDQILTVNGESFLDISHQAAVRRLKHSRHLIVTIRDVGKLPYTRTKVDETSWLNRSQSGRQRRTRTNSQNSDSSAGLNTSTNSVKFRRGVGSQLMLNSVISAKWDVMESLAGELLNDTEQGTLRYYLTEYQSGFISVDGLAMASFELLNTKAKMTMMAEIRNWVRGSDLDKFDILLQRREAQERQGFVSPSMQSLNTAGRGRPWSPQPFAGKLSQSAPGSRAATVRERVSRPRRRVTEWEMAPLRHAIAQIEDDPQFYDLQLPGRSSSIDDLSDMPPNLLKTSLSSRRSMSVDTLIPVYIDTTSDLPPSPRSTSNSSTRSRSNSSPSRHRSPAARGYQNRARVPSGGRQRHRSMEDLRVEPLPRKKITPYPSRRGSGVDPSSSLASMSYTHLHDAKLPQFPAEDSGTLPASHRGNHSNVVYADVHPQPRGDGIGSDDSGVDSNGSHSNEQRLNRSSNGNFSMRQKRVTISSDNPVNIDDVLEHRSALHDTTQSNHSTLTNQSLRSRSSVSTLTNQKSMKDSVSRYSDMSDASSQMNVGSVRSNRSGPRRPPVQILINDGQGSISSLSRESSPSRFGSVNSFSSSKLSHSAPKKKPTKTARDKKSHKSKSPSGSYHHRQRVYESDDEDNDGFASYEMSSDPGENSDLYVSPLDRVLDAEDSSSDLEHKTREEGRQKYGNIPLRVVTIYKTKPTLGMAIEGGANTRQPVPRVINLQPGGSAYESGGLKVGHVILEVNSRCLIGMEHLVAAKTIAESFKNKLVDSVELLVTDSNAKIKGFS